LACDVVVVCPGELDHDPLLHDDLGFPNASLFPMAKVTGTSFPLMLVEKCNAQSNSSSVDAFCGRVPQSVLARYYTDFSPERLKETYVRVSSLDPVSMFCCSRVCSKACILAARFSSLVAAPG